MCVCLSPGVSNQVNLRVTGSRWFRAASKYLPLYYTVDEKQHAKSFLGIHKTVGGDFSCSLDGILLGGHVCRP